VVTLTTCLGMIRDLLNRFPVNADDSILIRTRRAILRPRMPQACRVTSFPVQPGGFCEATLASKVEHRAKTGMEKLEPLKIPHAAYEIRVAKCVFERMDMCPQSYGYVPHHSHVVGHPAMQGPHAARFVETSVGRRTTASHTDAFRPITNRSSRCLAVGFHVHRHVSAERLSSVVRFEYVTRRNVP
jgi:hypothetical protein